MSLTFRPARADDVDAAVPLIYSSGPAAFNYVFGADRVQDFLRQAFVGTQGQFSHRQHWVGEQHGRVVVAGTLISADANLRNMLAATWQILRFYGLWSSVGVIRRGLQMEHLIKPPKKGLNYLAHLGVQTGLTGQGIGSQLIDYFLKLGCARGLPKAALDVSAENPLAQALYERLGFRVVVQRVSTLAGVPDHIYMERS
ncbi:GNAT family N-acetyltransferase [Pseudomonas turukhanskensis]|uniref:N-acetyltransferase n=1 Tax=Pseudomonas turukhanskensis TaxID=1806536 RepID=A0A9W6K900_9PSED|nr:GNAT family N-acetyltransferase [Pseudomonas turukhanskensis]GLK91740.1 N-acetyltransferase [Pseudomonas turukhanskensis]